MSQTSILSGQKIAKSNIIKMAFVAGLKLFAGLFSGMTVILADAITTFAHALGVFIAYIGLKLSRKTADKNFEYGYHKIETLAALTISVGIILLGYLILVDSIETFSSPNVAQHRTFAIIATVIAIYNSYHSEKELRKAGEEANSIALIASAKDRKLEIFAGIAVIISILANYKQIPYVEGGVSIILAIFVLKEGFSSAKESLFHLLDYWDDPQLKKDITKVLRKEKDVISKIKKIRLRRAGTFVFGEAFVEINPFIAIKDLRSELEIIKGKIQELNPYIKDFSIYTHIKKSEKIKVALPLRSGKDLDGTVANSLSQTQGYLFANIRSGKIKDCYYRNLKLKDKSTVELIEMLKKEKINILVDSKLNSLLYYTLTNTHQILIYPNFSDIKGAKKTLELLILDN